jgi:hypothetical protein
MDIQIVASGSRRHLHGIERVSRQRLAVLGVLFAATVMVSGCNTPRVRSDTVAEGVSQCHSYGWEGQSVAPTPDPFVNPINEQRLRRAVGQRLMARGLVNAAIGTPDCLVGIAMGTRDSITGNPGPRWSFGVGVGSGGYGSRSSASVGVATGSRPYREGRIAVDVYRAANRAPLWHAAADIDASSLTGADADKKIDAAVDAIFKRYPTSAGTR